jgi:phosphatidylglycerophosphate synthase
VHQLAAAQKSGAGVPAYLRWVNRGLGRRAAAAAYVAGLTPNAVTAISAGFSLAALVVVALAPTTVLWSVGAALLLLVGYALDSADGQLARLTGTGSVAGEWLDHVVDAARLPLVHLAIALHFLGRQDVLAGVALAYLVLTSVWFFAQILAEQLNTAPARSASSAPAWVSFVKLPYDVGTLYVIVALLAWPAVFGFFYGALCAVTLVVAVGSMRRKYSQLSSLSRDSRVAASRN